jgi:hypothetical protein
MYESKRTPSASLRRTPPIIGRVEPQRVTEVAQLETGEYTTADMANLFGVARCTVYRAIAREPILKAATANIPTTGN